MATKSFTTDYKFNNKSAQKLVNAMEKSENAKINRSNTYAKRLKSDDEIEKFMEKIKVN